MGQELVESAESLGRAENHGTALENQLTVDAASVGQMDISQQSTMGVGLDSIVAQIDPLAQNEPFVQGLCLLSMAVGRRISMRHLGSIDSEIPDLLPGAQQDRISIENLHHNPARRHAARR
jgi:hypothetical protein